MKCPQIFKGNPCPGIMRKGKVLRNLMWDQTHNIPARYTMRGRTVSPCGPAKFTSAMKCSHYGHSHVSEPQYMGELP